MWAKQKRNVSSNYGFESKKQSYVSRVGAHEPPFTTPDYSIQPANSCFGDKSNAGQT